jgi:hypothetical protein
MFEGFDTGVPNFFAPSLETGTVAKIVVNTVLSGESQVSALEYIAFVETGKLTFDW